MQQFKGSLSHQTARIVDAILTVLPQHLKGDNTVIALKMSWHLETFILEKTHERGLNNLPLSGIIYIAHGF